MWITTPATITIETAAVLEVDTVVIAAVLEVDTVVRAAVLEAIDYGMDLIRTVKRNRISKCH